MEAAETGSLRWGHRPLALQGIWRQEWDGRVGGRKKWEDGGRMGREDRVGGGWVDEELLGATSQYRCDRMI